MRVTNNKPLIFAFTMLPTIVILLYFVMSLTYNSTVFGQLKEGEYECTPDFQDKTVSYCCYVANGNTYCATCLQKSDGTWSCGSFDRMDFAPPTATPSPTAPENALPQGDVQQPNPTLPPTGGKGLFGSEGLPTPPTGLAPPTEPPAPTSELTAPPETNQGEEDGTNGGGGIKPPVKDLLPDTGITEQPDVQQPEEPSSEGQDTAGPLT